MGGIINSRHRKPVERVRHVCRCLMAPKPSKRVLRPPRAFLGLCECLFFGAAFADAVSKPDRTDCQTDQRSGCLMIWHGWLRHLSAKGDAKGWHVCRCSLVSQKRKGIMPDSEASRR